MVAGQTLPRSAEAYFATQAAEADAAIRAVRRQWARVAPGAVAATFAEAEATLLAVVLTAQRRMVAPVGGYFGSVLPEVGIPDRRVATPSPASLVGWAGDGRSIEGLLSLAPGVVLDRTPSRGVADVAAMKAGRDFLDLAVTTALWDTARHVEALEVAVRPDVSGYIRMLNPGVHGACSRCVMQAGRWFRRNTGFERHPRCRCVHVPAAEVDGDDLRVNPHTYFGSLSAADQDRIFTKAGAEAIREGADVSQVVNARRGMHTAQTNPRGWIPKGRLSPVDRYGRQVYVTTEGTTTRGIAYRGRSGRRGERLMPESILQLAESPEELQRMLRMHGYILP